MSQRHVENFIGRLATDRELRRAFTAAPRQGVARFVDEGHELGAVEIDALLSLDAAALDRFAASLDARIRRLGATGSYDVTEIWRQR